MRQQDPEQCDICGVWIAVEKFRQGRAVVILRKKYCPECIREAVQAGKVKRAPAPERFTPPPVAPPLPRGTRRLTAGEHGCGLYASEDERRAQLAPFVREGLLQRQKVLFFVEQPTPERILADFRAVGLPVTPHLQSGQLRIVSASQLREAAGRVDPLDIALRMAVAVDHAGRAGYAGLRIVCDMTWALSSLIDGDRLVEFEVQLTSLTAGGRCAALCQYSVTRMEPSPLHRIRKNHAVVLAKGTAETVLKALVATS